MAVLYGWTALPLIIAVLIATNRLRYRGWLAGLAFLLSLYSLDMSSNFAYNLVHWTTSRPSVVESVFTLALVIANPLVVMGVILQRSSRKLVWISAMLPLVGLTAWAIQRDYQERAQRDLAEYQQGIRPLLPSTGTLFTRCDVKHRVIGGVLVDQVYVQGHVPRGVRVTLLTDPFTSNFQPGYSTGVAGTYHPPASDPAATSNATEIESLRGYEKTARYNLAVIERPVTPYGTVSVEPFASHPELSHPVIRTSFRKLHYDAANFDVAHARGSHATAGHGEQLFISALTPFHRRINAFPCDGPAQVLSIGSAERVQAVLPYCVTGWNVFELNEELYFAATTQEPVAPGELVMGPDFSQWLFRVDQSDLHQIWPAP